ncbi:beta-glucosidase D [Penicillium lividum]|nr:beta-glucosidase D [Penicillium lividum]
MRFTGIPFFCALALSIPPVSAEIGLLNDGKVTLDKKWEAAYESSKNLVAGLSNQEKVDLITGSDMKAVGDEMYQKGFQVVNGPTSGPLGRTPWGGRLVETMGQDPYLNGIAFGLAVQGFSEAGVVAGGKHWLLNEQETDRSATNSFSATSSTKATYSSNTDDKTLHESYMFPFYDGVKAGLGGMMCAMSKVNGSQACESSYLINKVLKKELGFPGMVFPDASAQITAFGSANGGEDYGSSSLWNNTLIHGIKNGTMTQARLDDMAIRNVIGYFYAGLDDGKQPDLVYSTDHRDVRANHSRIIRENDAASLSLLKNKNNALPLEKPLSMALFGASAGPAMGGPGVSFSTDGTDSTYQGHLAGGSGSGTTSFPYLVTPHDALLQRSIEDGTIIRFGTGTDSTVDIDSYASNVEVCLVFINADSGEGADRTELRNKDQDKLVTKVASNCNNTMVIVNTVGVRILESWIDNENITAVVYGGLLGQTSGYSITDVLYGDVNPSGRLIHTIAKKESQYPVKICYMAQCNFTEGNYFDYRHFDKYNITPRYEFGYGLSYTTFDYSDIHVEQLQQLNQTHAVGNLSVGGRADLWGDVFRVTANITNSGDLAGHEVPQLYVSYPDAADQPVRLLRGFERVFLKAGESSSVSFDLRRRDLSHWDVIAQEWAVAPGKYNFTVGASSRDLRLSSSLNVKF